MTLTRLYLSWTFGTLRRRMEASRAIGTRGLAGDPLREEAAELAREAEQHEAVAKGLRREAALLRARAERLDDPARNVRRGPTARERVRDDGLMASAAVAVEALADGFTPKDLAGALGMRDEPRALKLLMALAEWGKVVRLAEGWRVLDPDEIRVRDYIVERESFTFADMVLALELSQSEGTRLLAKFKDAGLVDGSAGHYHRTEIAARAPRARPRHRPPEQEPPAGVDAPKRGEALYVPNHGKRGKLAQRGGRHQMKQRDARREKLMKAREERAERDRRRERTRREQGE